MNKSFFLSPSVVLRATETAEQSLLHMLKKNYAKRSHFHVVILNPAFDFTRGEGLDADNIPAEAILFEKSWGPIVEWKYDYSFYARSKALTAIRHQMPTSKIKDTDRVLLLQDGDAHLAGGVYEYGLAVGASGVEECLDEAIAWNFSLISLSALQIRTKIFSWPAMILLLDIPQKYYTQKRVELLSF